MEKPLLNKADQPPRNKGLEKFPRREGQRLIGDRKLTPAEIEARKLESEMMGKARAKRRENARARRRDR